MSADRLASLLRHAELFGVEGVYETAGISDPVDRAILRLELDAIEAKRKNGRYTVGRRRRRCVAETVELVALLRAQGLVKTAIADKLGISDDYVRKCLSKSATVENGGANPHG